MGILLAQAGEANVFTYFAQSNLAGKLIVLLLLFFSLLAWTVMFGKFAELQKIEELNRHFQANLDRSATCRELEPKLKGTRSPYARLLADALVALRRASQGPIQARFGHIENALQRGVALESMRYESKMVLLGSIVTGAPFLGLLGTVWGVMDAFGGIASGVGGGSIQQLAPGVSGALLTTVAALVVAIPSVFGYNFLLARTKMLVTDLENYASSLADRLELEDDGHSPGAEA